LSADEFNCSCLFFFGVIVVKDDVFVENLILIAPGGHAYLPSPECLLLKTLVQVGEEVIFASNSQSLSLFVFITQAKLL
jgi:hypothetical protein